MTTAATAIARATSVPGPRAGGGDNSCVRAVSCPSPQSAVLFAKLKPRLRGRRILLCKSASRKTARNRRSRRSLSTLGSAAVALRRDAKVELLKKVPLFAGCSKTELRQLAQDRRRDRPARGNGADARGTLRPRVLRAHRRQCSSVEEGQEDRGSRFRRLVRRDRPAHDRRRARRRSRRRRPSSTSSSPIVASCRSSRRCRRSL